MIYYYNDDCIKYTRRLLKASIDLSRVIVNCILLVLMNLPRHLNISQKLNLFISVPKKEGNKLNIGNFTK